MQDDPLVPASTRFPRDAWPPAHSEEAPTQMRPFVLRGAPRETIPMAKHRTPATRVPHTQPTTSDGKNPTTVPDTYYTPDD